LTQPARLDRVGTALAAILSGAAAGGALLCLILAAAHDMPRGPQTAFADIALAAGAAGLSLAAAVGALLAWRLGVFRAAMVGMVAVAGSALIGIFTTLADLLGGRAGLLVLAALCGGAILVTRRVFHARDTA
jgi:hypothetical protein